MGRFSISSKFILLSLGLVIITSTLVGSILYQGNNALIIKSEMNYIHAKLQIIVERFKKDMENSQNIMHSLLEVDEVKLFLVSPEENKSNLENHLQDIFHTTPALVKISIEGLSIKKLLTIKRVMSDHRPIATLEEIEQSTDNPNLNESVMENYSNPFSPGKYATAIVITKPVVVAQKVIGQLKLHYDVQKNISSFLEEKDSNVHFFITNSKGEYIFKNGYHYEELPTDDRHPITKSFIKLKDFIETEKVENSYHIVEKTAYYENTGIVAQKVSYGGGINQIILAITVNYGDKIMEAKQVRIRSLITAFVLVILASIFSVIYARVLTRNLNLITIAAKKYTEGETELDLNISSNDEIGILANTFQGMIYRVNERTRRIKRSEEKSLEAKKQAEQAWEEANEARKQAEQADLFKTKLLEEVKKKKEEIEAISKEKDDLMAIVSHDLKNPLAVIDSSSELLKENIPNLDDTSKDFLERIAASAKFSINLITDLLDLSRLEGGIKLEKSNFEVEDLIQTSLYAYELSAKKAGVELIKDIGPDLVLEGDYSRILQIINNIVGNALKFTPAGGKVTVSAYPVEKSPNTLIIKISDTGRGIPEDKLNTIFNKYEQAKSHDRKTGTGLGLAICKRIVDMHEGSIWVESVEGKGSTFHIELPGLTKNAEVSLDLNKQHVYTKPPMKVIESVLLIDDSDDIEALVKFMLKKTPVSFTRAVDGKDGIKKYAQGQHDLILMDMNMPEIDGIQCTKIIRALEKKYQWKNAVILAITASNDEESKRQCEEAGCNGSMNKPIKKDVLFKHLGIEQVKKAS